MPRNCHPKISSLGLIIKAIGSNFMSDSYYCIHFRHKVFFKNMFLAIRNERRFSQPELTYPYKKKAPKYFSITTVAKDKKDKLPMTPLFSAQVAPIYCDPPKESQRSVSCSIPSSELVVHLDNIDAPRVLTGADRGNRYHWV